MCCRRQCRNLNGVENVETAWPILGGVGGVA